MGLFLKHLGRQGYELALYCLKNRVLWPIPLVLLLSLAGALAAGTSFVAPYIYTLF
jgi:hypothetical protein